MKCDEACKLVPRYQDGELAEELAAPLRQHLLGCPACREVAKAAVSLKRWFPALEAQKVPAGFAAHVARRAFAGDAGYSVREAEDAVPRPVPGANRSAPSPRQEAPILPFVLRMTALAAALLLALAVGLQVRSLPESSDLDAESLSDVMQVIEALDAANDDASEASEASSASDVSGPGEGERAASEPSTPPRSPLHPRREG